MNHISKLNLLKPLKEGELVLLKFINIKWQNYNKNITFIVLSLLLKYYNV